MGRSQTMNDQHEKSGKRPSLMNSEHPLLLDDKISDLGKMRQVSRS